MLMCGIRLRFSQEHFESKAPSTFSSFRVCLGWQMSHPVDAAYMTKPVLVWFDIFTTSNLSLSPLQPPGTLLRRPRMSHLS